jgi:serine/threonine-protein phosphatase PP1 catalytic subunit
MLYKMSDDRSKVESILISIEKGNMSSNSHFDENKLNAPNYKDIIDLCKLVKPILRKEEALIEIGAKKPLHICGDIHGQYYDLVEIFKFCKKPGENDTTYLFLGDYIDRGKMSIETICLLFAYKILKPENIYLLRGNHEVADVNEGYGFSKECERKFPNIREAEDVYQKLNEVFNYLSIAAVVGGKILCMHGGIGPDFRELSQLKLIKKPIHIPDKGILCDILWADPLTKENEIRLRELQDEERKTFNAITTKLNYVFNAIRGISYCFHERILEKFLYENDLLMICRAHEMYSEGYSIDFNSHLVTVFSAKNYGNKKRNKGAVLIMQPKEVDTDEYEMQCRFKTFK